jgi:hypothetical protein
LLNDPIQIEGIANENGILDFYYEFNPKDFPFPIIGKIINFKITLSNNTKKRTHITDANLAYRKIFPPQEETIRFLKAAEIIDGEEYYDDSEYKISGTPLYAKVYSTNFDPNEKIKGQIEVTYVLIPF